jgi:transposase-like protein
MNFVVIQLGYDSIGHFTRYRCEDCNEEFLQRDRDPSPVEGHNCMEWLEIEDEEV